MSETMGEIENPVTLAHLVLSSETDSDSSLCILARQFLRALEREKQARLQALKECREIAEKSQNEYLQVTRDEGIPATERNRQRSMMLAVKSVAEDIGALISEEGEE